jgi:CspA family cold shock protein
MLKSCVSASFLVTDFDHQMRVSTVPSGKVKWYDAEKGFGFLAQEDGEDVYVRSSALPEGVDALKPGQRVEFGMAAGRRGPQALTVSVLEPAPSVAKNARDRDREAARKEVKRHSPDELHGMVADLITLLEGKVQPDLRKGRYPDRKTAQRISEVVRAVARELDR